MGVGFPPLLESLSLPPNPQLNPPKIPATKIIKTNAGI
jgi:hypothetical protein